MIGCCVPTGVGAALFSANVLAGSTVAVVGCGGVGLNVIMGAKLANAGRIIAVDIRESQLEFAMKFGATHSVNASDRDPVAQVKELTGGLGADYTFEVFGSADTIKAAYDMCGKRGTVTVVGIAPVGVEAPINAVDIVRNEKTMRGTYYGSARPSVDMPRLVDMYQSGKLNLDDLVVRAPLHPGPGQPGLRRHGPGRSGPGRDYVWVVVGNQRSGCSPCQSGTVAPRPDLVQWPLG